MSTLKDITKSGWHPRSKNGGLSEKWRDDFKGLNQVAGWIGKGKDSNSTERPAPYPIQSLKDPSSFGPPPKRLDHSSENMNTKQIPLNDGSDNVSVRHRVGEEGEIIVKKPNPPSTPYRVGNQDSSHLKSSQSDSRDELKTNDDEVPTSTKVKPRLPPRLPPRNKSTNELNSLSKNKSSLHERIIQNRPSINFRNNGSKMDYPVLSLSPLERCPATNDRPLSKEDESSIPHSLPLFQSKTTGPDRGTSISEKKAAIKTLSSLRSQPNSVSMSDIKSAAYTANNFRERHGHQVKSGMNLANKLNEKYSICEKIGSNETRQNSPDNSSIKAQSDNICKESLVKKRLPPPLPPKKTDLVLPNNEPPPIPVWTKPNRTVI